MKISKIKLTSKKVPFSGIMTIISFVIFIWVYWLATVRSIEPYYFKGLIFALPFVCFGIITYFTVKEKLKVETSFILTGILSIILGGAMLFTFIFIGFKSGTTTTTDIGKYQRVLKIMRYPNNALIKYFPDKIPGNAKDIIFNYNPAFLQAGETIDLKFKTDSDSIKSYIDELSQKAKWIGKASDSEAEKNGVLLGTFNNVGYMNLPEDFTIYVVVSKPYLPNSWDHGERSFIAISKERKEILFLAEGR